MLLTVQELSRELRISVRQLWTMTSRGTLPPPVRIGRVVRWKVQDIENWVASDCPASEGSLATPAKGDSKKGAVA